jgi:hypothetical protein
LDTEYNKVLHQVEAYNSDTPFNGFASLTSDEALSGPDRNKWIISIKAEIMKFINQKAWKKVSRHLVTQVLNRKLINCMMIFRKKTKQNKSIRYKTRIVSKGYMQIPGVGYTESFSPLASDTAIRLIVGLFLYCNHKFPLDEWKLELLDVEAAFLNSELDTEVYIEWPQGMVGLGFTT